MSPSPNRSRSRRRLLGSSLLVMSVGVVAALLYLRQAEHGPASASRSAAERPRAVQNGAEGTVVAGDPAAAEQPEEDRVPILNRMWWNRAQYYEPIGLDIELRRRIDVRFLEFAQVQRHETRKTEVFRAFRRALTDGEFESARERAVDLGQAYAEPMALQARMMVDVVEMLTPEQRRVLTDNYAALLSGPWLLNRGGGGGGKRR